VSASPTRLRLRLGRRQRLRGPREFARVRAEGERRVCGCLIANWRRLPDGEESLLGIVTSRKVGGSVVRSRARRMMREAYRLQRGNLSVPVALVLVARPSLATKSFETVCRDLRRCFQESGLWRMPAPGAAP
jgi:ribonuclease P protein component